MATKRTKTDAKRQARIVEALELKKKGHTFRSIAEEMRISVSTAHTYVSEGMEQLNAVTVDLAAHYKGIQLERLEYLWEEAMKLVDVGDPKAIEAGRKVLDSISKLMGVDAPMKIAPTNGDGEDLEGVNGIMVVPAVSGSVDEWLAQYQQKAASE